MHPSLGSDKARVCGLDKRFDVLVRQHRAILLSRPLSYLMDSSATKAVGIVLTCMPKKLCQPKC